MKEERQTVIYIAYDDFEPFDTAIPEKELLRAVLINAIDDLHHGGLEGRRAAEFFLNLDESEDYLFSFVSICRHLELNPTVVLRSIGLKASLSSLAR